MAALQPQLAASGTPLAFVHMGSSEQGGELLARYGLSQAHQFSDPGRALYRAFDLKRAGLLSLLGGDVVKRGFEAMAKGHQLTVPVGDPSQMPGAFLLHRGEVIREFRPERISDRPDIIAMSS